MERAAALGFTPMSGSELEFYLFKETYEEAHAKGYDGPDAVGAVHPRLPHPRHDLRRAAAPPDPQRHAGRRDPRRDLEGRGVAGPAGDQLPLRRRADDGRQPRRSTRTAPRRSRSCNGCSITFMAKPFQDWIGNSCHIHSSLCRDGEPAFARRRRALRPLARRADRVLRRSWRSSSRRRSTRTSATRPGAGRRRRSPGATTTARAASGSSATGRRGGSRRGSRAATSTRTSRSRR